MKITKKSKTFIIIVTILTSLSMLGNFLGNYGPSPIEVIKNESGEVESGVLPVQILGTYSINTAAYQIANEVYRAALKNPGMREITIQVTLYEPTGISDQYGNYVGDELDMGSFTVSDEIVGVEKYRDVNAYSYRLQDRFKFLIRRSLRHTDWLND